jgi:hypothetical protein
MNSRNTTDLAMPETGTVKNEPIKIPANSDPVAPPRLKPRILRLPIQ